MGRDIHLFVEYDAHGNPPFSGPCIAALADGEFHIPRDYNLFQCLAGAGGSYFLRTVAALNGKDVQPQVVEARQALTELETQAPLIANRGIPAHYSEAVGGALFTPVRDEGDNEPWMRDWPTRAKADEWVVKGLSVYCDTLARKDGGVSVPDYHTVGYLSLEEIRQSLQHHGMDIRATSIEFQAVVVAMDKLECELGSERTRIVFWFDN